MKFRVVVTAPGSKPMTPGSKPPPKRQESLQRTVAEIRNELQKITGASPSTCNNSEDGDMVAISHSLGQKSCGTGMTFAEYSYEKQGHNLLATSETETSHEGEDCTYTNVLPKKASLSRKFSLGNEETCATDADAEVSNTICQTTLGTLTETFSNDFPEEHSSNKETECMSLTTKSSETEEEEGLPLTDKLGNVPPEDQKEEKNEYCSRSSGEFEQEMHNLEVEEAPRAQSTPTSGNDGRLTNFDAPKRPSGTNESCDLAEPTIGLVQSSTPVVYKKSDEGATTEIQANLQKNVTRHSAPRSQTLLSPCAAPTPKTGNRMSDRLSSADFPRLSYNGKSPMQRFPPVASIDQSSTYDSWDAKSTASCDLVPGVFISGSVDGTTDGEAVHSSYTTDESSYGQSLSTMASSLTYGSSLAHLESSLLDKRLEPVESFSSHSSCSSASYGRAYRNKFVPGVLSGFYPDETQESIEELTTQSGLTSSTSFTIEDFPSTVDIKNFIRNLIFCVPKTT